MQALGDAIDEEIGELELAEVPSGKGLVLLPEPFGHLAHRRAAQHARPCVVPERRLDVAGAQPPGEHLDSQALQFGRPACQPGAYPGHKRLGAIGHLRDAVLDRALGCAQAAAPIAIPVAGARRRPVLVVVPPDRLGDLSFQRLLHDLPHGELE